MSTGGTYPQGSGWSMKLTIHLHPANNKNTLRYTSNLPFVFIMLHLIKHRDNFGFDLHSPQNRDGNTKKNRQNKHCSTFYDFPELISIKSINPFYKYTAASQTGPT
jgi:hypothetical protein